MKRQWSLIGRICSLLIAITAAHARSSENTPSRHELGSSRPAERWEEILPGRHENANELISAIPAVLLRSTFEHCPCIS